MNVSGKLQCVNLNFYWQFCTSFFSDVWAADSWTERQPAAALKTTQCLVELSAAASAAGGCEHCSSRCHFLRNAHRSMRRLEVTRCLWPGLRRPAAGALRRARRAWGARRKQIQSIPQEAAE
eukprot:scaffold53505_cov13-Prasinocladus_malaysianus.AAC.1